MGDAIRRSHARIPCDTPVEIFLGAAVGRLLGAGRLLNISLSGAFLVFEGELQRGTPYRIRPRRPRRPLELPLPRRPGRPARRRQGARRPPIRPDLQPDRRTRSAACGRLVDVLRRQPATEKESDFDRSLRNYWSS